MEAVAQVRAAIERGALLDDAAQIALELAGGRPIDAIKIVRDAAGISLGDAKSAVHPRLPEHVQRTAEALWDAAEEAARE